MQLTQYQIEFIERTLCKSLTVEEQELYADLNSEIGCFQFEDRPPAGRKLMVLYTACTGIQVRAYLRDFRPEIYAEYDIYHIFCHALSLRSAKITFQIPPLVQKLFQAADVVFFNPVDSSYPELSNLTLNRLAKPGCKFTSYGGPHQECWWAICPLLGDLSAIAYFESGLTPEGVWKLFKAGTFNPQFEERFKTQMAFQKGYQHGTDGKIYEFIRDHYRRCKLFFTFNHASCHLIAYSVDQCLGTLGYPRMGADHAIDVVPADHWMVGDVFPETHYEWDYYKLTYPMRWQDRMGGIDYYKTAIEDAYQRWLKRKQ